MIPIVSAALALDPINQPTIDNNYNNDNDIFLPS